MAAPSRDDNDMSATPSTALRALTGEKHQNLAQLRALSALMAQKLPEEPSRVHSIVIVGLRGVGKSTLALMALAALGFRYLDVEKCVSERTGMPEAVYLQKVTVEQYQELQYELVTLRIRENAGKSQIIVMPLTVVNLPRLMAYLARDQFAYIVNVECEEERILSYLHYDNITADAVALVRSKMDAYHRLATHDFFNCFSELALLKRTLVSIDDIPETDTTFFVLKPVERDFIRFLTFLIRGPDAGAAAAGNLHLRSIFFDRYTNCLSVPVPLDNAPLSVVGVDCIELTIDIVRIIHDDLSLSSFRLSETFAKMRRLTNSAVPFILAIDTPLHAIARFIDEYAIASGEAHERVRASMKNFYLTLLGSAIRLGCNYLAIDLALCRQDNFFLDDSTSYDALVKLVASIVANRGSTEIIGTYNSDRADFWDADADAVLELADSLGISIVRMSAVAHHTSDNFRVGEFHRRVLERYSHINVCAYNRGTLGAPLKVFNRHMTPVVPGASADAFSPVSLHKALFSARILPRLQFYIMGQNVTQLASPLIHEAAYAAMGLEYTFRPLECTLLMPQLAELEKMENFGGAAIIMPFKLEALKHVDSMLNHVKVIGALNTIVARRSVEQPNKIVGVRGENTDWLGMRITLQENTLPINAVSTNKTALVVGAGGMARSAIYALIQLGYTNVLLYNRTKRTAEQLADHYNRMLPMMPSKALTTGEPCDSRRDLKHFRVVVLLDEEFSSGTLPADVTAPTGIVSCVPSSNTATGEVTKISLHSGWFASATGGVVLETGYEPLVSSVLERAAEFQHRGWTAVNGLNWLLAQAIAQFEMFTGKQAPVGLMKDVVGRLYERARKK